MRSGNWLRKENSGCGSCGKKSAASETGEEIEFEFACGNSDTKMKTNHYLPAKRSHEALDKCSTLLRLWRGRWCRSSRHRLVLCQPLRCCLRCVAVLRRPLRCRACLDGLPAGGGPLRVRLCRRRPRSLHTRHAVVRTVLCQGRLRRLRICHGGRCLRPRVLVLLVLLVVLLVGGWVEWGAGRRGVRRSCILRWGCKVLHGLLPWKALCLKHLLLLLLLLLLPGLQLLVVHRPLHCHKLLLLLPHHRLLLMHCHGVLLLLLLSLHSILCVRKAAAPPAAVPRHLVIGSNVETICRRASPLPLGPTSAPAASPACTPPSVPPTPPSSSTARAG